MPLRVLQFSDIHFSSRHGDQTVVHGDVRDQVLADLHALKTNNVDAILIAGDIAFAGKRSDYQDAANWVERVRAACGCPRNAVLIVPGNHDVDRDRIKMSTKLIHRSLRNSGLPQTAQEIAALAGDTALLDKLSEYQAFAASYGCSFGSPLKPTWTRSFAIGPQRTLSFIGLTTVQVCDEHDTREGMLLGSQQFIIPRPNGVEQVVVMHHPLDWLKDRLEASKYLTSRARVLIVGHEHVQDLQKVTTLAGEERLIVASGALTPAEVGAPFEYRYNILEFDTSPGGSPATLAVTVYPRVWSPQKTAFMTDHECLNGGDSATLSLRCPMFDAGPCEGSPADTLPVPEDLCRLRHAFWRRLAWQDRIRVLTTAKILPPIPETPLPHSMEEQALRGAETDGKLYLLWDTVMAQLPEADREPNPFVSPQ